jgi:catechol 2,3-dioxygenase-like lactoylglutathione lyase family enzyme
MRGRYSAGLDRREALTLLGSAALGSTRLFAAAESPFKTTGIDHVTLAARDAQKSLDFYTRLFGNTVLKGKKNGRYYVQLGPVYMALDKPVAGQRENSGHYLCLGIENFDTAELKRTLNQLNIATTDANGDGLLIQDPDGIVIQFWGNNSWSLLSASAAPFSVAANGGPRIKPSSINHLLLAVSDPDKSATFYERFLGSPFTRSENPKRIWFRAGKDRVGLSPLSNSAPAPGARAVVNGEHLASGQYLGLDHFGLVAPFDRAALRNELRAAGATVLPQVTSGPDASAIDFLDPNGVRIQVSPPPQPRP